MTAPRTLGRILAEAACIAAFGLLGAVAAGAVAVAGIDLLAPELLGVQAQPGVLRQAVTLGLGGLRVPLELGDATGVVAPLTGAVVAFAGIAWGVRTRRGSWAGHGGAGVVAVGACLAAFCTLAAIAAAGSDIGASVVGAAVAGLGWGTAAAFYGMTVRTSGLRVRPPPTLLAVAAGLVVAWLAAVAVVSFATGGVGLQGLAGSVLLVIAFAPNVLSALVAFGCGARVEAAVSGSTDGALGSVDGVALWDWPGGPPWFVAVLVMVPLVASVAASFFSTGPPAARGVRNGVAFGAALLVLGWAGSFQAASGGTSIRFGIDAAPAFLLGLAWGVAGSFAAAWLQRDDHRSRVEVP